MIKSLVIGASGLIGSHLIRVLSANEQNVIGTYHKHPVESALPLDISDQPEVEKILTTTNPEIIFLPGAFPNVDYCETHPAETRMINVIGVQYVVKTANKINARLIFFSSDYIFDGKCGPYHEEEAANPISEYGKQKLAAEHFIALYAHDYLIIRTTVVYGWEWQGKNFVYRLIKSLEDGKEVKVPTDQIGSPTYANNLAQITINLSRSRYNGVVNVSGPSRISRFDFAVAAAHTFHLDSKFIKPITTEELKQPAKRPLNAGLVVEKISRLSDIKLTGYQSGLEQMSKERPI